MQRISLNYYFAKSTEPRDRMVKVPIDTRTWCRPFVFTTQVYLDRGSNPYLPHARRTLYLYATAAVYLLGLKDVKRDINK